MGRTGLSHMGSAADKSKENSRNVWVRCLQTCPDLRAFALRCAGFCSNTAVLGRILIGSSLCFAAARLRAGSVFKEMRTRARWTWGWPSSAR